MQPPGGPLTKVDLFSARTKLEDGIQRAGDLVVLVRLHGELADLNVQ